jgi:hypothetical protein
VDSFSPYATVDTVDEQALATDMMGDASLANQAAANKNSIWKDPTKSLIALWVIAVVLYMITTTFFRGQRS